MTARLAAIACAVVLLPILLVAAAVSSQQAATPSGAAPGDIPPELVPIYRAAGDAFHVHWLLLAAIHQRETDFSRLDAPGVRSGWNGCGAAGPMQFGIVGVAPYNGTAPDCGALAGSGAG